MQNGPEEDILRAVVSCERGIPPEVLRRDRRSRESTGSTKTAAFRGSILGGSDQADSRLSFVVPLIELILDGFSANRDRSFGERWQQGLWPPCFLILCTWATYPISHQESFSFP